MFRFFGSFAVAVLVGLLMVIGGPSSADPRAATSSPQLPIFARQGHMARPRPASDKVLAYGLVIPPCVGCAKLPRNFTPLSRIYSWNVVLASPLPTAPLGTWCFGLNGHIDMSRATIVSSLVKTGGPRTRHFSSESLQWVVGSPDCKSGEIEIQTIGFTNTNIAVPSGEIAFSFVVL